MTQMILNEEKNGVELYFDEKPSAEILSLLKADKAWFYYRKKNCWCAKQSEKTLETARKLAGSVSEQAPSTVPSKPVKRTTGRAKPASGLKYTIHGYKNASGTYTKASYSLCNGRFSGGERMYQLEVSTDHYGSVPMPSGAEFVNNSDSFTDYFEHSRWFVTPDNPDYLAILDAMEAKEAYEQKLAEKREIKRYGKIETEAEYIERETRSLMRLMSYDQEKAEARAREKAQEDRERKETYAMYKAMARAMAQMVADARATGDEQEIAKALEYMNSRIEESQREQREKEQAQRRASALHTVEHAKKRGICTELEGVAFIMETKTYQIMFERTKQQVYTILAIDTRTGDTLFCGEFHTPEERQAIVAQICNARRRPA